MKLTIKNLSKTYNGDVRAISNVSMCLRPGMFGLLGPNGAGKSSLMRTLATLQEPDEGEIRLGEWDLLRQPDQVRRVLGYLPQDFGVYPKISAMDLLEHFALLKGIGDKKTRRRAVEDLLHLVNLYHVRNKSVDSFSGGMVRRWGIAQALLGDPKLIIVDEPTAGLDPEERNRFHRLLSAISEKVIVMLSTHIVSDVAELCAEMAVMDKGRLLLTGKPQELISWIRGRVWKRQIPHGDLQVISQHYPFISSRLALGETWVRVFGDQKPDEHFQPCEAELEDVYFSAIAGYIKQESRV